MNTIFQKKYVIGIFCLLAGTWTVTAIAQPLPWVGATLNGRMCSSVQLGGVDVGYGPWDYRIHKKQLPTVEGAHFTLEVENLVRGKSSTHPMNDVDYTLRHIPNHHRALYTAVRFSLGESSFSNSSRGQQFFAECYLQRAMAFSPRDPVPYLLFGLYLHRLENLDQSLEMYERAEEMAPNDANLLYNLGLLHFDRGSYAESRHYAEQAYSFGMELSGLRRKLQDAGHWER